jgi:predicted NBD/HSP70 family sugar kinase
MGVPTVRPSDWQVLQVVHRLGAIPQHKLADLLGRNRSTVNGAVQRLLVSGWLVRAGQTGTGRGRPAILLAVNKSLGCFAGIDIAADELHVAVVGADGTLQDQVRTRFGRDRSLSAVLDQIDLNLRGLLSRVEADVSRLLGVWAGINGAVNDRGVVVTCASHRWYNVPLRDRLSQRYGCDTLVQGSAGVMNAAAESLMGAGREAESLVYYHVGRGISARLVSRGRALAGRTQRAGEFGHVVVEPGGPKCACGNRGCLEAVASGPAIVAALSKLPRRGLPEPLRDMLRQTPPEKKRAIVRTAFQYANGPTDRPLTQLLRRVTAHLALGAAMAVAAYDPDVLVLGGYAFEDNPALQEGIRKALRAMVLDWEERKVRVVLGEVMSQDRAIAGAAEVCQRFWANPRGVVASA